MNEPKRTCVGADCEREALPGDIRCEVHRWAQWTLREPEWVRRMHEGKLPAKEMAA